jgi:hypothetical protein
MEDGAIAGRTAVGCENSFLCTKDEFGDFELKLETMVDDITNQGILYGEALGTGWLSSTEKQRNGHDYFVADGWNKDLSNNKPHTKSPAACRNVENAYFAVIVPCIKAKCPGNEHKKG